MPQVSAADLRSAPSSTMARASIRTVLLPPRRRTKLLCRQIKPYDPNRSTHRCCSSLKSKHRVRVSPIWESKNESKAAAVGISGPSEIAKEEDCDEKPKTDTSEKCTEAFGRPHRKRS